MIEEQDIETYLIAIRSLPYEVAREHLRTFANDCRQAGMFQLVNALQASGPTQKNLTELKQQIEERGF